MVCLGNLTSFYDSRMMVETTGRAILNSRDCAQFRRNFAVKEKSTVSPVEFYDVKLCINSSLTKPAENNKKLCSSSEKFLSSSYQISIIPLTPPSTAPAERLNRHTCCHALKNQCATSYSSQSSSSPLRALPFLFIAVPMCKSNPSRVVDRNARENPLD